ncbi:peptide n-myristoyl transferase [Niveomyces insectorum RCEF 264]|uniref:Glycylpeptide N-tetradecanoyltransferase n=1 Tax=Niveomyces insectorum RCEF 264 TaxID=1081102 RepID=A0A167TGN8_9HYPO|nr:peptide n-myristoyl transferase [Niveomyces insectorum RCEF 264]
MAGDSKSAGDSSAQQKTNDEQDQPSRSSVAAGKQPAVESDDEHEDEHEAANEGDDPAAAATGTGAAGKKKKSKRKKNKAAATTLADAEASLKKTIANLPPSQVAELLKLNPAISQELAATTASGGSASASGSNADAGGGNTNLNAEAALAALKRLRLADIMTGMATSGKNVKDMASYKFWQTQPVPKFGEDDPKPGGKGKRAAEGPIVVQTVDDVAKEPAALVEGFEWDQVDLTDDAQLQEVFDLLTGHFVEDGEAMFRLRYSKSILKWAMMSPGWTKDWHIGVRATQSRKLVAFISAIPLELRVRDTVLHASEVNFLVIHKKLRSKRLAPVLIKEITRLCNAKGVWQALYTAGVVLPKPVSTSRYYHRSLDWQKLYDVGFSPLPANSKPQYQVRKYAVPDRTSTRGLRAMEARDVDAVQSLLTRYLARFDMAMEFTKEEVAHWLLDTRQPGEEQFIYAYVVEDENKTITDMFSFYRLDSSIINHPRHSAIHAAYLFYYATEVGLAKPFDKAALKARLNALMADALVLAKKHKFDVLNALSIMDNALFLEQQKYGPGDGQLHYYLFNYRAQPIAGGVDSHNQLDENTLSGIGFVMM